MRYALNENGQKITPQYSGQRAYCKDCKKEVTGKIYRNKIDHWAHLNNNCDRWHEPMTEWHIKWQEIFPKQNQEVTLIDENTGEFHRADIILDNGVVIEIQNSKIPINEVEEREKFYNKNGLIWILNAENLIPKSRLINYFKPANSSITISFDKNHYSNFEVKDLINGLKEKSFFIGDHIERKSLNGDFIEYTFYDDKIIDYDFTEDVLKSEIESLHWKYSRSNYNSYGSKYKIQLKNIGYKFKFHKVLARDQWRRFIDKMESPVFLDNVTDLHSDYLYWVQRNKIIEKEKFINKYLKETKTAANNGSPQITGS